MFEFQVYDFLCRIRGNFCWIKISTSPATFVLQKVWVDKINFRQCGKGRHILYVIIYTGQKKINFSPMRAGGEISESFLLAKFHVYGNAFDTLFLISNTNSIYYRMLLSSHMTLGFMFYHYFIYSLRSNNISDAGAQALAEGLQHCSNLQMLK